MPGRRHFKHLLLVALAAALVAAVVAAWLAAPSFVDDPLEALAAHTPVRVWTDRNGAPLWYERTYDGEWRFPVRLGEIPVDVREFTLNVEDERFYEHGGVDYAAVARAALQNLASARVLSGASTISMQVASMAHPGRGGWRWARKLLQAVRARKAERLHSKDEILEAYFNHLPYGGKIVGIRAAAEYYFGLDVGELTRAEASLLVGVPQSPNRLRPDRHPEAARARQRLVLDAQVRAGRMTRAEADALFGSERLRYRDFGVKTDWMARREARELRFLTSRSGSTRLDVDPSWCDVMARALKRRVGGDVRDAAAVAVDVESGELRGYVGTLDFGSKAAGQVDAARAVRSAGSTLKPFIYLEALEGGIITPLTPLLDAPLRYGGYAPENFDGTYRGEVTAAEALSLSLNTPVVRLLAAMGEGRVAAAFEASGLSGTVKTNGLSLALGSAGYRLVDIAMAYRRLAKLAAAEGGTTAGAQLAAMLRARPLPGAPDLDVAWKTGTSNNLKDAWCFAYTPDLVVGVWFGNKDGKASQRLVGVEIAAPAAGEIMNRLAGGCPAPEWGVAREGGVPLARPFDGTRPLDGRTMIISPAPQTYRLAPGAKSLALDLKCSEADVYWFLDGTGIGSCPSGSYEFREGRHRIVAVPRDPSRKSASVSFTVVEGE